MTQDKKYSCSLGIKLTKAADDIACFDEGEYRALLSCGHACDPNSLTEWCRSLLDDGKCEFRCPALLPMNKACNQVWPYDEVRRLGLLTTEEAEHFERSLNNNWITARGDLKQCPNCSSLIEREEDGRAGLMVECLFCRDILKAENCGFCWQCGREWLDLMNSNRSSCGRPKCRNKDLDILAKCSYIRIEGMTSEFPSIRACPKCGKLAEHDKTGCKNVTCPRCSLEFCFACLEETTICSKTSTHYRECSKPVHPVQTSLARS